MSEKELNELTKQHLEEIKVKYKKNNERMLAVILTMLVFIVGGVLNAVRVDASQSAILEELPKNYMTYEKFMEYNELLKERNELESKQIALNTQLIDSRFKEDSETYKRIEEQIRSLNQRLNRVYNEIDFIKNNYKPKERGIIDK